MMPSKECLWQLMARAAPGNCRGPSPRDWWDGFLRILDAFFTPGDLSGRRIVDLGPGHYQFCTLVAAASGCPIGIERDPALVELGVELGYEVVEKDVVAVSPVDVGGPVDGLFAKYAVRTFEATSSEE